MAVNKKDDAFAMASFDPSKVTENFRNMAETGAVKSKEAFGKIKEVAEDATKTIEATMKSSQAGSVELGLKAIDAMRANTEATLSHMEALLGVKSVSQFVELQSAFFRNQAETSIAQAKGMGEATRILAESVTKPGKDAVEKAFLGMKLTA